MNYKQKSNCSVQLKSKKEENALRSETNNTGIPVMLKSRAEKISGFSFDNVRVHYNSSKPAQLSALAYTQGNDIHVAPNQEKHLPHELGHVVQQKEGRVSPTTQLEGVEINDDPSLEDEADLFGGKINS